MIQWHKFLSLMPQVSSFFNSSTTDTNPLDCIKNLIQELSCPKPRPILKQKVTKEFLPSPYLIWRKLIQLVFSWKDKFSSSTNPITQLKNLLIQDCIEKTTFIKHISSVFNQRLLSAIQKTVDRLPDPVRKKDLEHLFTTIGCNLTISDLNHLLEKLYKSTGFQSFRDKKALLDFIYIPPIQEGDTPLNAETLANSEYEYYIHKLTKNAHQKQESLEEANLLPFVAPEQLARIVAYASLDLEELIVPIPLFTEQQHIVYYQLSSYIKEKGLYCYLFTPLGGQFPAHLVFRGTDDKESLFRDFLDPKGIGKTVFDEYAPKITEMINSYCESTTNPALEISGHSLGGVDAQRATILCASLVSKSKSPASRLSHISCFAFCSPKLDRVTIKLWEQEIDKLKQHQHPPQISLNFANHRDDGLTQVGYGYINKLESDLKFLEENHLQAYSKSGILGTNTHHREPFFKEGKFFPGTDDRKYISYNSADFTDLAKKISHLQELLDKMPEAEILLEKELKSIESFKQKLAQIEENKKKIESYKEGYSSDSSWVAFFIYLLIVPGQYFFHLIKQGYPTDSYWIDSLASRLSISKKNICNLSKKHFLKM